MTTKLNFYTEKATGGYVGKCQQLPGLTYGPKRKRDTALSGVKRAAKKLVLSQGGLAQATAAPTKSVISTKPKKNLIRIVIDRSGSMRGWESDTARALNSNLETLKRQAALTGQETLVEVVMFDTNYGRVCLDEIRFLASVGSVRPIAPSEITGRGGTPLMDATGESILKLERYPVTKNEDVAYMVMVLTDGENNEDRLQRFNASSLSGLIKRVQATDLWTLTFLTPPGKKNALVRLLGVPEGNVQEWEQTTQGYAAAAAANSVGISSYFSARTLGATSTKAFYTTDLSNVSSAKLKSALQDLSGQFKVLTVKQEADIKPFVESETGVPYRPGSAFYQLTKDEKKIQDYKQILIMEKGKKTIYGGPDARGLLGLPVGQDVKVRPGNHANFDIFVQSSSLNRKLVRGTKLLVQN